MGRPSDTRRSAQRPGKRERARVKKRIRTTVYSGSRAGTYTLKAGRKKYREAWRSRSATNPFSAFHLLAEPIPKAEFKEVGKA